MEQPSARYHHAVVKGEGKEAYIFGGYDEKRNRCLGDLHRYEYSKFKYLNMYVFIRNFKNNRQ